MNAVEAASNPKPSVLDQEAIPQDVPNPEGSLPTAQETHGDLPDLKLFGTDGATSLKAEINSQLPQLHSASHYRAVRKLLRTELGGPAALKDELVFAGFVDPETGLLTTNDIPFNIFVHVAVGKLAQPGMDREQAALGSFAKRFCICSNRAENDLHWDSVDPAWAGKASMSSRHRFLTTRNLHWQWFNALVFGMVPASEGGCSATRALQEVHDMKLAALHYAKYATGWSANVGLFVNVFGHNSVNCLFIHIIDLSETGPPFLALNYKNCPLDDVLKVLGEEAALEAASAPSSGVSASPSDCRRRSRLMTRRSFFFAGTDGATSLKAEITGRIPILRDAAGYREARRLLLEELGGIENLREELARVGVIDRESNMLTTGTKPFNFFARVASGEGAQPGMAAEQEALGEYTDRFLIVKNRQENDEHWDSDDPAWVGKASMSRRHRFLTVKDLHWKWFNALVFGLVDPAEIPSVIARVEAMQQAALQFAAAMGYSKHVGLFFHVFGHNSVNSLHLHILDMAHTGPSFDKLIYKNCPIEAVLKVLKEEDPSKSPSRVAAEAAAQAATAAAVAAEAASSFVTTLVHQPAADDAALKAQKQMLFPVQGDPHDLLVMNVAGEMMLQVTRGTMLVAPKGSKLHRIFAGTWDAPFIKSDSSGRIFLDLPPQPFKKMVDHLRLLHASPSNVLVSPPECLPHEEREFRALSTILGVEEFFREPRAGRADGCEGNGESAAAKLPPITASEVTLREAINPAVPSCGACQSPRTCAIA